jgi:hypothetical protein
MAIINGRGRVDVRTPIDLSNPLWNSLVAGWKLDGDFTDVLGVANGTSINDVQFTTGKINQGVLGNGSRTVAGAKFVDCGTSIANRNLQFPLALSSWVRQDYSSTISGSMPIWFDGNHLSATRGGVWLQVTNPNALGGSSKIRFGYGNGTGVSGAAVKEFRTNNFVLAKGVYHHVVINYINASTFEVYVNGVSVPFSFLGGSATSMGWTGQKTILCGSNNYNAPIDASSPNPTFEGGIDEVYLWNKTLTISEITELYNSGNGKQYAN